ncbi:hypothetical protein [Enterococcus sp. RIT-PI-f]|uniref:hypothetical protein n=1 Tax=Enterococcus sp. RIT-PI-f TaxID=1690244 RepID=UPI0006B95B48|nr:hypothetical protein [Enterococcus sp. RIT-PI-f]KPG69642.1 hypothetical protein AEQ18_13165 [Enterococcus sp. RIT-PI-f]
MKKYHVISAKNFGFESELGDGTYDYFVYPEENFSQSDVMNLYVEVTKYTTKNNNEYPYTPYEYQGTQYCSELYGKQYYEILYNGIFDEDKAPLIP